MGFFSWLRGDDEAKRYADPKTRNGKPMKKGDRSHRTTRGGDHVTVTKTSGGTEVKVVYNGTGGRCSSRTTGILGFLVGGTKQAQRDCQDAAGSDFEDND